MIRREKKPTLISANIERVLFLAATDDEFRARLFADRRTALQEWGLELSPAELAVLDSQSNASLESMIANIHPEAQGRRRFMKAVAAASVVGGGVSVGSFVTCTGTGPDIPMPDAHVWHDAASQEDAEVQEDAEMTQDASATEDAST